MLTELFLKAFVSFLVIANPIGVAAVFMGLMAYADRKEVHKVALKAALVSAGVLLAFAFFGEGVLIKFGITLPAFRVAGGILLFSIAYKMLFGEPTPEIIKDEQRSFTDRKDVAIFPLAVPLIAGPGCISLTIIMMSKTETNWESCVVILAILAVMVVTWLSLRAARRLQIVLGNSGMNLATRVMGILLSARAIQIIADGIQGLNFRFYV